MKKNKKAVFNPVSLFFIFILADIVWIFAVAPILGISTDIAINNGADGLETFLLSNINLWIFSFQLIALLASIYIGGEQ